MSGYGRNYSQTAGTASRVSQVADSHVASVEADWPHDTDAATNIRDANKNTAIALRIDLLPLPAEIDPSSRRQGTRCLRPSESRCEPVSILMARRLDHSLFMLSTY